MRALVCVCVFMRVKGLRVQKTCLPWEEKKNMPLSHILWKGYIKYVRGETAAPGGRAAAKKTHDTHTHDPQEYVNINYLPKRDAAIWIECIFEN